MENGYAYLPLKEKVSFFDALIFSIKVRFNTVKRFIINKSQPILKHKKSETLLNSPYQVFSESLLWNASDSEKNWMLTAGKVENLRVACQLLNGLEIEKGEVFSFWKQIGVPNAQKGFTIGRELREGCIVPTIAGGLCQLSNALYDCALKMNLEIIERHKHTKVVKGSLAEQNRDATVKWNYIDLRFKSNSKFRIEAKLTEDNLIVTFKSHDDYEIEENNNDFVSAQKVNDCYSCGNTKCFKHPKTLIAHRKEAINVFVLDDLRKEYYDYINAIAINSDLILTNSKKWLKLSKGEVKYFPFLIKEKVAFFKRRFFGEIVYKTQLKLNEQKAIKLFQKIPVNCNHIIISQSFLPFAIKYGVLGGRTYDVIMNSLPLSLIHERLDLACTLHPKRRSLNNFRANKDIVKMENVGLTNADKIISSNKEISNQFKNKTIALESIIPVFEKEITCKKDIILFPNKLMARYGAEEMVKLSENLQIEIHYLEGESDHFPNLDDDKMKTFKGEWSRVKLVCNPSFVEGFNGTIAEAIGRQIPILSTSSFGLSNAKWISKIEFGNFEMLKLEMKKLLDQI